MSESCLVTRLSRYAAISEREAEFLARMEEAEERLDAGSVIQSPGDPVEAVYVLKHGWAVQRAQIRDGRTAILRVYLPGEVMGLAEIGPMTALHTLAMRTEGAICRFPRAGLTPLFQELPRLAALFTAVSSLDHMALRDKVAALGLFSAEDRLIHFLLDLRARLAVGTIGLGNRFRMPFSQVEIGQAVGLTSIYVNRLLRGMVRDGRIEIERPYVRLLDRAAMERRIGYVDHFRLLDTTWFPEA